MDAPRIGWETEAKSRLSTGSLPRNSSPIFYFVDLLLAQLAQGRGALLANDGAGVIVQAIAQHGHGLRVLPARCTGLSLGLQRGQKKMDGVNAHSGTGVAFERVQFLQYIRAVPSD